MNRLGMQLIKEFVEIKPTWIDIVSNIVIPIGSLLGVIVTVWISNITNKKNMEIQQESFMHELNKAKTLEAVKGLNKSLEIFSDFLDLVEMFGFNEESTLKYNSAVKNIIAYGNVDTVKTCASMQQCIFDKDSIGAELRPAIIICFYAVMISQIKYDVTAEFVKPEQFLKIGITDYYNHTDNIDAALDFIFTHYQLSEKFKPTSM